MATIPNVKSDATAFSLALPLIRHYFDCVRCLRAHASDFGRRDLSINAQQLRRIGNPEPELPHRTKRERKTNSFSGRERKRDKEIQRERLLFIYYLLFRRFRVLLFVEFLEQEEEHDRVHADPPDKRFRVVAVDEQQLERVDHDCQELDHLQCGQVLLPPQILLDGRSQRGQQVVRVHDYVHERVQQAEERAVSACVRQTNGERECVRNNKWRLCVYISGNLRIYFYYF